MIDIGDQENSKEIYTIIENISDFDDIVIQKWYYYWDYDRSYIWPSIT